MTDPLLQRIDNLIAFIHYTIDCKSISSSNTTETTNSTQSVHFENKQTKDNDISNTLLKQLTAKYDSNCDKNVCLLMTGSFFPIHNNHIFLLNEARTYLLNNKDIKYNVICCIITVTHSSVLTKKFHAKKELIQQIASHRIKICQIATQNIEWIIINSWLSSQNKNVGAANSKKYIQNILDIKYGKNKIDIITIIGDDNIFKMKNAIKYGPILCVLNRNKLKDIEQFKQMDNIKKYAKNLIVVNANINNMPSNGCSSTKIRNILREGIDKNENKKYLKRVLDPNVLKYHILNGITYKEFKEKQKKTDIDNNRLIKIHENNIKLFKEINIIPIIDINSNEFEIKTNKICGKGNQGNINEIYWNKKGFKYKFALKTYILTKNYGTQFKGYKNELNCLSILNDGAGHNNIIKLFGCGYTEISCFMIFEYLDMSLREFIDKDFKKWWNKNEIINIPNYWLYAWSKFVNGCNYMNNLKIMHRDLTISNIMVRCNNNYSLDEFELILIDFGCGSIIQNANKITRGSTRHYAPESIGNNYQYTTKSEVYSFGNILYEFIHRGQIIYNNITKTHNVWKYILNKETPQFTIKCNHRFESLIKLCWTYNPEQRPTFQQIEHRLIQLMTDTATPIL